jgi:outer membrane lipoprotein-sorting protein
MLSLLRKAVLILFAVAPLVHGGSEALSPEPASAPPLPTAATWAQALDSYLAANRQQQDRLLDSTMEVEIQAKLPRMKREALQRAMRHVAPSGEISYEPVSSTGDNMVRKEVVARYMTAEADASKKLILGDAKLKSIGITRENYKFSYKGLGMLNDRQVYVFQLTPKQKRLGLFKGEVWVDSVTFQTLRESGTFVKNPSIYLSKVQFVRQYEIQDGLAIPTRVTSRIETRMVGRAEIDIRFSGFSNILTASSRICPLGW